MATWVTIQNYLVKECLLSEQRHQGSRSSSVFRGMSGENYTRLLADATTASISQQELDYLLEANASGTRFADLLFHSELEPCRCEFRVNQEKDWLQISSRVGTMSMSDAIDAARNLAVLSNGGVSVRAAASQEPFLADVYATHSAHLPTLKEPEDIFEYWLETALDAQHLMTLSLDAAA